MAKVRYKIPSQAASGADTFSDSLVGVQITDGSSQLTNTNFTLDRLTPERDVKDFINEPFSDFVTLDNLSEETNKKEKIKFKDDNSDAGKSLFGSLKLRLNKSINNIITKFPAYVLVDSSSVVKITEKTAENIIYDSLSNTTTFTVQQSILYNPLSVIFNKPKTSEKVVLDNEYRNFYSAYKNYVIEYDSITYDIIKYIENTEEKKLTLTVNGNLFIGNTSINENFFIRLRNGIIEEFYGELDDIESLLLNRETNPIYNVTFRIPKDSFDDTATDLVPISLNWPLSNDGKNILIIGLEFSEYIDKLTSIADEIDDYKSNLIVRFLTAPQLFEFDTEDKKAESIFQLYGQNFDIIKKYIDNITYMRNVSYDKINNLPDLLLKNLSQNLGLNSVNLFNEKSFKETLYKREESNYNGLSIGKNLIDSEHEFYRRLLINLSHLYKSKGTRSTLIFLLKFLGAPEEMIKIDEYVYNVKQLPNISTVEDDIFDIVNGIKNDIIITGLTESSTGVTFLTGNTLILNTYKRKDYPIDEYGKPRKITSDNNKMFFQKGSGWYNATLEHQSPLIIDYENSILTGRTKYTKTKHAPFTYGEDYFSYFKKLPGLDYGFELESKIDNKKINLNNDKSDLILNRKNLNVYLSPSQLIDYDLYKKSRNNGLTFGILKPQTGQTFAEYINNVLSITLNKSNIVKYEKSYINLKTIYDGYVSQVSTPYDFITLNEFIYNMSPYWTQIIEQFIPATTLWNGGNLITNSKIGRSKYQYKKPCQIFEMVEDRYPNFNKIITELSGNTLFKFYPVFDIDNITYSGSTFFVQTTLPVDYTALNNSWSIKVLEFVDYINLNSGFTRNNVGKDNTYGTQINNSQLTGVTVTSPILSVDLFTNNEGIRKIKFKSYKYSPRHCTVMKTFNFQVLTISQ